MDDIKRPRRPRPTPPAPASSPVVAPPAAVTPLQQATPPRADTIAPSPVRLASSVRRRHRLLWVVVSVVTVALICVGGWFAYLAQLAPVDPNDTSAQKIVIASGDQFGTVAQRLKDHSLIRSTLAFEAMARISGKHNSVKAGTCTLMRTESAREILDKITSGCHDFKAITFYPGATLYQSHWKPNTMNVTSVLLAAGYDQAEIDEALAATYTTKGIDLFAGKPDGADLEGYVYGETYYVDLNASAKEVIQTALDQMATDVRSGDYEAKFRARGLTLYQGITLASIVQRELSCSMGADACYENQRKVAQVFDLRLANGMTLGSDVTFYYGADKLGVDPSVDLDSPYNTRIHQGLTPGPIATPGMHALDAVANPANTPYLFFVAGDDGGVYFATTDEEHQTNVTQFCQKLCSEL